MRVTRGCRPRFCSQKSVLSTPSALVDVCSQADAPAYVTSMLYEKLFVNTIALVSLRAIERTQERSERITTTRDMPDAHLTTRNAQLQMGCDAVCTLPTVCTGAPPTLMRVTRGCRPRFCCQNSVLSTGHGLTSPRQHRRSDALFGRLIAAVTLPLFEAWCRMAASQSSCVCGILILVLIFLYISALL